VAVLLTSVSVISLSACGASRAQGTQTSVASSVPQYVSEPFTRRQQLIEKGGGLIVSDGCAACHLANAKHAVGPSFDSFAGHDVTLADGHRVLVNERFLREGLLHPGGNAIEGYDPAPMLTSIAHLHLGSRPEQVAALIAFIEQVGPEPG
jgi:cytochrome c551/c552